jgi:acetyltransferase-like isoleucine patch superfamily enzyme
MSTAVHLEHDWCPLPLPSSVVCGERSYFHSSFALLHSVSRHTLSVSVGHDTGVYRESIFDLGPGGRVSIGDFCTVVGAIFCTNGSIAIGNHVLISREVVFADRAVARPFDISHADDSRPADTIIGSDAWIGTRVAIMAGSRIGEGSIVGAGSVVDGSFPPFTIVAGNPARVVGRLRPGNGRRPSAPVEQARA